jgi:hypothetical protein
MSIEPHLVLKHISYLSTPKNLIFLLVTRVNTRDFTVHVYLSQNWDSDGHFEVLNESKS